MTGARAPWLPVGVGVLLSVVLMSGVGTVATAGLPALVPTEILHNVQVEVVVGGKVTVATPDLDLLQPGQLIPSRVQVDGLPDQLTVDIPISIDGAVDGEHSVVCTGCAP